MDSSEIDSESLQAVRNLKSKFERLASETSMNAKSSANGDLLAVTAPASPRPRAASNSQLNAHLPEISHLRTSSSSSDLRVPTKKAPPPPPPPRGSKLLNPSPAPSPLPSPLLRPVPIPPGKSDVTDLTLPPSVSALRNKFVSTPPASPNRVQSPRQSPATYPAIQIESRLPPAVPPRPVSTLNILQTTSPDQMTSPHTTLYSPFSEEGESSADSTKTLPPPIPSRRNNGNGNEASSIRSIGAHFSDSSQTSYDSDASLPPPQRSPRSAVIPPRPPPRNPRTSISPNFTENAGMSSSVPNPKLIVPPPPLPVRRSTVMTQDPPITASLPPPLPNRTSVINGFEPVVVERKLLGSNRLPPPPTRMIGLGDKLPPPRRPPTPSSDEESGEEDEPKVQAVDMMPDSSTSSRRPPTLGFRDGYAEPRIHIHPHTGCATLSGSHVVVGHGHHLKIYDLAQSEVPILNMDTREMGMKDVKVTCMELRPSANQADRGSFFWVGTKEGHLFEVDIRVGSIRGAKYTAHLHPITHIFRHGRSMVTLDESGKTLIFSPEGENLDDISLQITQPRVIRTTEKQDFVKMLDGKLWTAARVEHHGSGASTQRLPIIRIYDIFNPASTGRSVLPLEHVGPVTSATIIPSQPTMAYVGHEEGYISMWELDTEDGYPRCAEVMKVSMSDVLSLEGVNNRLWAGSRNGMISAYDVSHRPWVVTNCWNAHPGLPVMKLMVNHYAIVKTGRLCVASIGRDEQLRLWDGLLGLDWVEKELAKTEATFSTFKDLTVLVVSWNCDSARPDALTGEPENVNFLNEVLHSVDTPPDVIVFGFQEVIDLESRKMAAKSVLLTRGKKKIDDGLSEKVTGAYKRWYERLVIAVKTGMPRDTGYSVVHTENLVGLFSCIFVKTSERTRFDDVAVTTIKRGMGGRYGNKGGIVARFVVGDSSICFINCHLAAGQNAVRRRNADIAGMLEENAIFTPTEHPLAYVGGGDGTTVLDHEFVVLNGDLNYRIDHRRDAIISSIRVGDLACLLPHDQLLREIKFNRACRLRGFTEGTLTFNPTYKYDRHSNEYDSSEKHRSPAWCDRILWRSRVATRVRQLHYRRYEANVSDHRPISAAFAITVKTFDNEAREGAKAVLQANWVDEQERLLMETTKFYVNQALL